MPTHLRVVCKGDLSSHKDARRPQAAVNGGAPIRRHLESGARSIDSAFSPCATQVERSGRDPVTRTLTERSLVKALGTWGLAASIVNLTVGGGIFRLPATAAGALGAAAPVAYIVCAVAMGLIVVCFAEAGSRVSLTGGLYAYVEVAFGPLVGFLSGVMLWTGITAATSAVTSFFADALGAMFPLVAAGTGARRQSLSFSSRLRRSTSPAFAARAGSMP